MSFDQTITAAVNASAFRGTDNALTWLRHTALAVTLLDYDKPVVIVDIDGVLYNWCDTFSTVWCMIEAGHVRIDWTSYHAYEQQMSNAEYKVFHAKYGDEIYGSHQRVEFGLAEEIARLHEYCAIAFVTARPIEVRQPTIEFLDRLMGGRPYVLEFSTEKTSAERLAPRFAIDDSVKHAAEFLSLPTIELVGLRSQAYNRNEVALFLTNEAHGGRLRRIEWFAQFVDEIEDIVSLEHLNIGRQSPKIPDNDTWFDLGGQREPIDILVEKPAEQSASRPWGASLFDK